MILSPSRILKRETVFVDTENKIVIDTDLSSLLDSVEFDSSSESDKAADSEKKEKSAKNKAKEIVQNAELQAEKIINDALAKAQQHQTDAREKAALDSAKLFAESREKGHKDGMDAAKQEGEAIKNEARQVLEEATAERARLLDNLEPEVVDLIIEITEKLLGKIPELNPALIINLIKQGFAGTNISGSVTVYVSADDYDAVIENKEDLLALTDGSVKLEITKDLSLSPMDCVIETPFGDIDCSLGQQFEALSSNLNLILNSQ